MMPPNEGEHIGQTAHILGIRKEPRARRGREMTKEEAMYFVGVLGAFVLGWFFHSLALC
jgi:hypothetical protein